MSKTTYVNHDGRHDTYWRRLPETDDPAECLEYLLDWWRSKRKYEDELYGEAEPTLEPSIAQAMVNAEEQAIEALLDALTGAQKGDSDD